MKINLDELITILEGGEEDYVSLESVIKACNKTIDKRAKLERMLDANQSCATVWGSGDSISLNEKDVHNNFSYTIRMNNFKNMTVDQLDVMRASLNLTLNGLIDYISELEKMEDLEVDISTYEGD
jgi:hypothetical protein